MKKTHYMPIAPISVLEKHFDEYTNRTRVMVLAHLCEQGNQYTEFYQKTRHNRSFILLDNGAAENSQLTDEQLFEKIELIQPTCVVAPDTLYDGRSTVEKTFAFVKKLRKNGFKCHVMAVPHGSTEQEYLSTFKIFNESDEINWIGVSKFVSVKPFIDRCTCMYNVLQHNTIRKPIHILGCNNPIEMVYLKQCDNVYSIDSCIAWLYGYNNLELPYDNSLKQRLDTPEDFFDYIYDQKQIDQSISNVIKMDKLCNL